MQSPTTEKLRARDDLYMKDVSEDEQLRIALEQSHHTSERADIRSTTMDGVERRQMQKALKESLQEHETQRKSKSDILSEKEKSETIKQQPQWPCLAERKLRGIAGKSVSELSEEEQLQLAIEESKLISNRELSNDMDEFDFERNKENRVCGMSNLRIPGQLDGTDRESSANDSTYGSVGSSPFGFRERKSLSGEKRQRQDSGDSGLEIIGSWDAQGHSRKRLCLDESGTEELAKQLTETNNDSESVYQFNLSDDGEDKDMAKALSISVTDKKKEAVESDFSRAISESLKDVDKHVGENRQLDEAVALSLMEQDTGKRDSTMTEEEQLRRALELSLQGC